MDYPEGAGHIGSCMNHVDLFAGIGGFTLAAQRAGIDTILFSEIESNACKVLEKNFPGIPNAGDIKTLTGDCLRDFIGVDIIGQHLHPHRQRPFPIG